MIDMKTKVARGRSKGGGGGGGGGGKNRGRNRKFHRRESSTSVESHSRIFNAKTKSNYNKRRSASAGLDPLQINAILGNPKLLLPFLQTQMLQSSGEEDEEEVNSTSVHVKNIDVRLKQQIKKKKNVRSEDEEDIDYDDLDDPEDILNRIEMDMARNDAATTTVNEDELEQRLMVTRMNADNANNTTDDEKMSRSRCNGPGPPGMDSLAIIKSYMEGAMQMNGRNASDTQSSKNSTKTRNSGKSNRSRKSLKKTRRMSSTALKMSTKINKELVEMKKEQQQQQQTFYSPDYGDSSVSSFNSMDFSNVDMMNALGTLHSSSFSGVSKTTNSRNSKRSCDVGIQANAHEIVTASGGLKRIGGGEEKEERNTHGSDQSSEDSGDDDDEETMCLSREHRVTKIVTSGGNGGGRAPLKKPNLIMTESDKLKMLLLPSPKCQAH